MPKKIIIDVELLKEMAINGKTVSELRSYFNVSDDLIRNYIKKYNLPMNKPAPRKWTSEEKEKISLNRKQWLKDNPDKHPWRNKDKFKSKPCEKVKEFLKKLNILFIEEYQPEIEGRSFSIDIAMPDKMIALEINGNQHYERDGKLKPYYQERHDLLESHSWDVYEIHYSACFNLDKWKDFVDRLLNSEKKVKFDYFNYKPVIKNPDNFCKCGKKIWKTSKMCRVCNNKNGSLIQI